MSSNFANSWLKRTPGNLEQTQMHRQSHLISDVDRKLKVFVGIKLIRYFLTRVEMSKV